MTKKYKCKLCGRIVTVSDKIVPMCCGKPAKEIQADICIQPAHAEHARPMNDEDACDEGRSG